MHNLIEPWEFLAGLAVFLYGMRLLENALNQFGGATFNRFLRDQSRSPIRGVMGGTVATMCLQSSSMVGLLVLAFVGAGLLEMRNALGIVFGANLGTTFTGWLVALLGFKLNLTGVAIQLVSVGGLAVAFVKRDTRLQQYGFLVLGLGFLLLGLDFMKSSIEQLADSVSPEIFRDYHPLIYLLGAAAFTALIQSSSATMMILLSAVSAGVLPLSTAVIMVIGADLGTTSTMLLGGMAGTAGRRQVALSHFIFNLVIVAFAFLFSTPLLSLLVDVLGIKDPMYALVSFHSTMNLVGVIVFLPFVDQFAQLLKKVIKEVSGETCQFIPLVPPDVTLAAREAIDNEVKRLLMKCMWLNLRCFRIDASDVFRSEETEEFVASMEANRLPFEEAYADIKHTEDELLRYISQVQQLVEDPDSVADISRYVHAVRDSVVAAKTVKDIRHNMMQLRHSEEQWILEMGHELRHTVRHLYRNALKILGKSDAHYTVEKIKSAQDMLDELRHSLEKTVHARSMAQEQPRIELSTLLNISRAVSISSDNILEACADVMGVDRNDGHPPPGSPAPATR